MGVIVNKENNNRNELQRRIDADLRNKQSSSLEVEGGEDPDFAEDSEYVKNMKTTSKFGWVWIVLVVLAIISLISIIFL